MNRNNWKKLLSTLEVITDGEQLVPVDSSNLAEFEKTEGLTLPASYKAYCEVFGAGQLGNQLSIAVPCYQGEFPTYSMKQLTQGQRELSAQFADFGIDSAFFDRGLFFALDIVGSNHLFFTDEITNSRRNEYAVYTINGDTFSISRTADDFSTFIMDVFLGDGHDQLIQDQGPPDQVFRPVV